MSENTTNEETVELATIPEFDNTDDPERKVVGMVSQNLATLMNHYHSGEHSYTAAMIVTQAAIRLGICPLCLTREIHEHSQKWADDAAAKYPSGCRH